MSKTKFIKVSVEERLPEKTGWYFSDEGLIYFVEGNKEWIPKNKINGVLEWLEEVPDREEEMRELLEELVTYHFDFMGCGEIKELQKQAEQLLNK